MYMLKTIYIITNEDKAILRAFTNYQAAMKDLDKRYSEFGEEIYLEHCALEVDAEFINNIKN